MGGRNDLARLVVLEGAGAVDGGLRDRPAQCVVAPGGAVDLSPGAVPDMLPFGQPPGQIVRGGRLGDDLGAGDVGRTGDAGSFPGEVVREVDPLGGDRARRGLLLLDDLRHLAAQGVEVVVLEIGRPLDGGGHPRPSPEQVVGVGQVNPWGPCRSEVRDGGDFSRREIGVAGFRELVARRRQPAGGIPRVGQRVVRCGSRQLGFGH